MQAGGKGLGVVSLAISLLSVVYLQRPAVFVEGSIWADWAISTRDSNHLVTKVPGMLSFWTAICPFTA